MKRLYSTIFIFILAYTASFCSLYAEDNEEWIEFVIPEKIDEDEIINIGKLVLDAPAGKHGFLKTQDDKFVFEDGTEARFWGTNLCFGACFPDKEQAEILADRIAFFGFNAVRFHHMDYHFEPEGIFEDICPAYNDPQMKETGHLSETQLDRLDYFIYLLKERGIYINLNLLVSRHFTEADGVKNAAELDKAAKPVSMFDPVLIELQKKYAKDLLTHYNPYTKLKYNEDPAIAFVEIINESSILEHFKKGKTVPSYYSEYLDQKWEEYINNKYPDDTALQQAWSNQDNTVTEITTDNWKLQQINDASAELLNQNETTTIKVTKISDRSWYIQYFTSGINVEKGKIHSIKFQAKANKDIKISIVAQKAEPDWNNLGLSQTTTLNTEFTEFYLAFTATENFSNAKIGFILGAEQAEISLKNIQIYNGVTLRTPSIDKRPTFKEKEFYPSQVISDLEEFYTQIEKKYYDQIYNYLKNDLYIKIPVTGSSFGPYEAQTTMDFIDHHSYWDHPKFPNKPWDKNDFTIKDKSTLQDNAVAYSNDIIKKYPATNKPKTLTEWNHCYPNQYAYETPLILAAEARKNNINALFQFAFKHHLYPAHKKQLDFMDIDNNYQQLILNYFASYIYLKDENISTLISDNVYYIQTPTLHAAIGSLKGKKIKLDNKKYLPNDNGTIIIFKVGCEWKTISIGKIKNNE